MDANVSDDPAPPANSQFEREKWVKQYDFDREKWLKELESRQRELAAQERELTIKEGELEVRRAEAKRTLLSNPLASACLGRRDDRGNSKCLGRLPQRD